MIDFGGALTKSGAAVFFYPPPNPLTLSTPAPLPQSPLCLGYLSKNDELCMTKQAFKFILGWF